MNILIPGGAGFVGKDLVKKLLKLGYNIIVIDKKNLDLVHRNLKFYRKDLLKTVIADFIHEKIDIIVNCIGQQYVDTSVPYFGRQKFFDDTNVGITKQLLDFVIEKNVRKFIFISTDMVYGVPKYLPIDEKHPTNPVGPYGLSKLKAENIINIYTQNFGLNSLIIRPRLIIGKGRGGVIEKLLKLFKYNLPVPLFGDGKNHYQMINLKDLNEFIILSIQKDIRGIVNIGSEKTDSFENLYKILKKGLNSRSLIFKTNHSLNKVIFWFLDKIGFPLLYKEQYEIADKHYILDISLAKQYGWFPKISDKQSILEIISQDNEFRSKENNSKK